MSFEHSSEERRLNYLARAEEARVKAEETTDPIIREWWERTAEAWEFLADSNGRPNSR